ncbi:MAG: beta-N-acetylhexosaminidase [Bacteroidetes bacterium]|nr:beta-N-acetylhexosaminidase [Bacteroidota bacterium]
MRFLLFLMFFPLLINAQQVLVPTPAYQVQGEGSYILSNRCTYFIDSENAQSLNTIQLFSKELETQYNVQLAEVKLKQQATIRLLYKSGKNKAVPTYELLIDQEGIQLTVTSAEALHHATRTLLQLITRGDDNQLMLPYIKIEDYPRFQYRGMHLDVGRHFFPVRFIKQYIDWLSFHKLNKFHWHLTEDQGWRVEIKKYPALTNVGAWRNGTIIGRYPGKGNDNLRYGGFYTQEEIKEVVAYAQARFIEVIPEIEMPGHSSAAIAAYPFLSCFPEKPTAIPRNMISEKSVAAQKNGGVKLVQETWGVFEDVFCAGKETTFEFLQQVIDEIIPLFPSPYFHIGGDECPKSHWKLCALCQHRIKELGLKDEHELQSYFIQRIEKYLNSKGKTLIGWDEILEGGLAPNAIVMSWRGEAGGIEAAKQDHSVIMTPGNPVYFDHAQALVEDSVTIGGYNPIEKVFAYNPLPQEIPANNAHLVLGAQANVWTEYMKNEEKIAYMIFPRIAALSEILWTPQDKKNWTEFEKNMGPLINRYEQWGIKPSKAYFEIISKLSPAQNKNGVELSLSSKSTEGKIQLLSPLKANYEKPILIQQSARYQADFVDKNRVVQSSYSQQFEINKATGKDITLQTRPSKSYSGNGGFTLVNGIRSQAGKNIHFSNYLGFDGGDLDVTIDLGQPMLIQTVKSYFLHQPASWIHQPLEMQVSVSVDGIEYKSMGGAKKAIFETDDFDTGYFLHHFKSKARFVKIVVTNSGRIKAGFPGEGNKPWLFIDEIQVD